MKSGWSSFLGSRALASICLSLNETVGRCSVETPKVSRGSKKEAARVALAALIKCRLNQQPLRIHDPEEL
jgi:hypothetical protein